MADPVRRPEADPHDFHRYVSADPTVAVDGTALPLPGALRLDGEDGMFAILAAVSAVGRLPVARFGRRGAARMLLGRSLRLWSTEPVPRLAAFLGVHETSVLRTPDEADRRTRVVAAVLGDPRFFALDTGDLRTCPSRARYRHRT